MVGMEMRDDDRIDLSGIDAGGGKIRHVGSRSRERAIAGAGVDGDEPRAGIDDHWVERDRERLGGLKGLAEDLLHLRNRRARYDGSVQLAIPYSVADERVLVVPELGAVGGRYVRAGYGCTCTAGRWR